MKAIKKSPLHFGGAYDYVNLRMQYKTGMVIQG